MKGFHKNSRRIENEVFILYMPDHELVTASNLQPQLFRTFSFWNGIVTESSFIGSNLIPWY